MPKIKLKECENYEYQYSTRINIRDINYGGHLGNDSLVGILHEARIDLLNKMGFSELDLGDGKTGIIMSDLAVKFIKEGFLLDEIIVYSHIDEISNASFRIFHKIVRVKDNALLALAETGIVCFNYKEKAISDIPEAFLQKIGKL
ncbi:MAG TPA: thioesterase family protein [Spirochaetota bacterium]|nr:thioesterase family protein [Spirochaetota bacterium]HOL57073.1 thioesterase family protein [Spirochaetota bacterium]HPP04661.1 thioesterase family protein [Spirochaetota bacterium]